jgi:hypothetical protein
MSYWLPKVFVALWFIGATTAAAYMLWYETRLEITSPLPVIGRTGRH